MQIYIHNFPSKHHCVVLLSVTQIVEKFFSKEIKYLVSNKKEARYVQCLRQDSPVPSPDSTQSSPHPRSNPHRPGSHGDNNKSRSQGQTDTVSSLIYQSQYRYAYTSISCLTSGRLFSLTFHFFLPIKIHLFFTVCHK